MALVTLEGASTIGGSSVAEKFMRAMASNGINVLIITQASSEASICVAVPENEGEKAVAALRSNFELELARSTVGSVSSVGGMSIVAIIGEGMAYSSGISATFMTALARANVNIRLIAQGSSERQVAVVVKQDDATRALRAVHMAFTLSETTASVVLLGSSGAIGRAFVEQLRSQRRTLIDDLSICPRVMITANSRRMTVAKTAKGLPIDSLNESLLGDEAENSDMDRISAEIEADVNPHRVIIDCTNNEGVSEYYERWMEAGIDIISPSRKIAAGPLDRYNRVSELQRQNSATWQYTSSVGSALPVLATLKDLVESGDKIHKIRGSVSGTLAYILSTFDETTSFSQALAQAVERDFAESDIREDLSGADMARKVVILARQLGINVELEDVEVESLLTKEMTANEGLKAEDVESIDADMLKKFTEAKANGRVLRYKFEIVKETGKCRCFLDAVDRHDPLYRLKSIENLVAFETDRFSSSPMIIKGAAAGPDLAAAGIFSDLLRLTRAYSSERA